MKRHDVYGQGGGKLLERWEPDDILSVWHIYDGTGTLLQTQAYTQDEIEQTLTETGEQAILQDWQDFKGWAESLLPGGQKTAFRKVIRVLIHRLALE